MWWTRYNDKFMQPRAAPSRQTQRQPDKIGTHGKKPTAAAADELMSGERNRLARGSALSGERQEAREGLHTAQASKSGIRSYPPRSGGS